MHQVAPLCTTFEEDQPGEEPDLEACLGPQQVDALRLILVGHSMSAVARAVGVDRSTLFRWRRQADFAAALRFRQEAMYQQAADRLRAALVRAMREIEADLRSMHEHVRRKTAYRLLPYVGSAKLRPVDPRGRVKPGAAGVR